MISRERVIAVINHKRPDRVPIYGWVKANLSGIIEEAFGSVENFEDKYEFDFSHLFAVPPCYAPESLENLREQLGHPITPPDLLELPMTDVNDLNKWKGLLDEIRHHKEQRGRFVYVQTPGIFEALNTPFQIENHLCYMIQYEKELHEVYRRQAEWNRDFANNSIDLGVDMVHVSDDWGSQNGLLFSPKMWWEMIYPYHKIVADTVKGRNCFLSLHSDGNVNAIIDGMMKLGFDVVHPWQESAGMSLKEFKRKYRKNFTVMGGLDVQTTIGFGKTDFLVSEIERVLTMFKTGGLLFCTTHYIQDHCSLEELVLAFDTAYELTRKLGK